MPGSKWPAAGVTFHATSICTAGGPRWVTMNPAPAYFPGGLDEMKATAERIRAAGLNPESTPSPPASARTYTLAKPLSATDKTIFVNEMPAEGHDVIWSYSGNGNALRGKRTDPLCGHFAGAALCLPGVRAGGRAEDPSRRGIRKAVVDYLQQRYIAFYPDPKSPLADELAERIARVYNAWKPGNDLLRRFRRHGGAASASTPCVGPSSSGCTAA